MSSRTRYYRDKQNGKIAGVCAGIADYTGIDALIIRIIFVVAAFAFGWPIFAYIAMALFADKKPTALYEAGDDKQFWQQVRRSPKRTTRSVNSQFRDIDRRLADVEYYYTRSNARLAREIDSLKD